MAAKITRFCSEHSEIKNKQQNSTDRGVNFYSKTALMFYGAEKRYEKEKRFILLGIFANSTRLPRIPKKIDY